MAAIERTGIEAVWLDAQFEAGARRYNAMLANAESATRAAAGGMSRAMHGADQATSQAAKGMSLSLTDIRQGILLAIGVFNQFKKVVVGVYNAAAQGAQQLRAQRGFIAISGGAEQAAENLQALREATKGAVDEQTLMEQSTLLLTLRVVKNSEELGNATKAIIRVAGQLRGMSAEQAITFFALLNANYESSKRRLDEFGLSVDEVEAKIREFQETGVSKKEAIRLALLAAVQEKYVQLGGGVEDAKVPFDRLSTVTTELSNKFEQALAPGISSAVQSFVDGLPAVEEFGDAFLWLRTTTIQVAAGMAAFDAVFRKFTDGFSVANLLLGEQSAQVQIATTYMDAYTSVVDRANASIAASEGANVAAARAMEDNAEATEEAQKKLETYTDAIEQIQIRGLEQLVQMSIDAGRRLEDEAIDRARKIEDIERASADKRISIVAQASQKRSDVERQYNDALAQAEQQANDARASAAQALARQLEQIDRTYNERRRQINQQFALSFQAAVRSRDALALVEAVRTRDRDLKEAQRNRDQQRSDARADYNQQMTELQTALETQRQAARQARDEQLRELQENLRAQLEEQCLSDEKAIAELDRSLERQHQDQALADARKLEDMRIQAEMQRTQAIGEYMGLEELYRQHLERMLQMYNRYQPGAAGITAPTPTRPRTGTRMAEGGMLLASSPTQLTVGEAGPELVMAAPLRQIAQPASVNAGGQFRHIVSGAIQAQMAGFQGRLTVAVNRAVLSAVREVMVAH